MENNFDLKKFLVESYEQKINLNEGSNEEDNDRDEELIDKLTPVSQVIDEEEVNEEEMLNESFGMAIALAAVLTGTVVVGTLAEQIKKARKGEYGPKRQKIGDRLFKLINDLAEKIGGE